MNIIVQTTSFSATIGTLFAGGRRHECTLGRAGVTLDKREGDGATPVGTYPLRELLYRPDRVENIATGLQTGVITPDTGWCEDPAHKDYNHRVALPHPSVRDCMWREDGLFDMVVVVGYNDDPVVPGRGSAIFMHMARPDMSPTAGCVGLARDAMLEVLALCDGKSHITILPPPGG